MYLRLFENIHCNHDISENKLRSSKKNAMWKIRKYSRKFVLIHVLSAPELDKNIDLMIFFSESLSVYFTSGTIGQLSRLQDVIA